MLNFKEISRYGFGAIVLEKDNTVWVDPNDFLSLLDICTQELGINYIDSASGYGDSEKYLGQWLKSSQVSRDRLLIGSKVSSQNLTSDFVVTAIENSLKQTQLEYFDIYWVHKFKGNTPLEEGISGFAKAIESGKIRGYGICNTTTKELSQLMKICQQHSLPKPMFIQNMFSLATQDQTNLDVLDFCEQHQLIFTCASPLAGGILTGKYQLEGELPENSRWKHWGKTRGLPEYWNQRTFDGIEKLKSIAGELDVSLTALSLAWARDHQLINCTLIGPRNPSQLNAVKESSKISLTAEQVKSIGHLF